MKSQQKKEISTFRRLLLIFLAIIFPIILTGFCAIGFYGKKNEQEALNLIHMQMDYHIQKYEENMMEIRRRAISLMNNADLQKLANVPEAYSDFEHSRAVLRVQHELDSIKNFQSYIADVCVMIPKLERVIHADGYPKGGYTRLMEGELEEASGLDAAGDAGVCREKDELVMPLTAGALDGTVMYLVLIRFSEKEMAREFGMSVNVSDSMFRFEIPKLDFVLDDLPEGEGFNLTELPPERTEGKETASFRWNNKKWYIFREASPLLEGIYEKLVPAENIMPETRTLLLLAFLFFTAVTVCICVFFMSAHRLVNEPVRELVAAFQEVEKGNFKVRLSGGRQNDFGYLYQSFNRMAGNLQSSIDKIYSQKLLLQKTELRQLQAQINPHFLYNTYFLLHRLIKKEDYDRAVFVSKEMGAYFRYITRSGRDVVTLREENEHAGIYARMQGMRFEGRIRIEYRELPQECAAIPVPRLILQPILENAFGHGLENKEADGLLRVSFQPGEEDGISIFVEDNGDELTDGELLRMKEDFGRQQEERSIAEVTGMVNINRRMKIFYGKNAGLYLSRSALGGLCVEVRIPGAPVEGGAI